MVAVKSRSRRCRDHQHDRNHPTSIVAAHPDTLRFPEDGSSVCGRIDHELTLDETAQNSPDEEKR